MRYRKSIILALTLVFCGAQVFVHAGHVYGASGESSSALAISSSGHPSSLANSGDTSLALSTQYPADSVGHTPPAIDAVDGDLQAGRDHYQAVHGGQFADLPAEFLIPGHEEKAVPLPVPSERPGLRGSVEAYEPLKFSDYANGKSMDQFLLEKLPADFMTNTFGGNEMPEDDPSITVEHRWLHNNDEAAMERETLFNLKVAENQQSLDDAGGDYKLSGAGADTLIVSVGSSSTQIYSANAADTASFDCGTLNFDAGQVDKLADAVEASGMRKVVLINSIGRAGTVDDDAFVPLSDIARKDLTGLPGVKEIASKFQAKVGNKDVKVFNRVKVEDSHGKKDYKYRQLDNNFADGLAETSKADVVVDLGGSSMKIYHNKKRVFSATVYTNEVLVHDGKVDEGLTDYFCKKYIKAAVEAHVDGPVKRVVIGQTGQARELHFKEAEAIKTTGSQAVAPSPSASVAPAGNKMPALRDPKTREEPATLIKPLKSEGKRGKYKLTTPSGTYVVDRPGRAETIDYQFVKPGSEFELAAVKTKVIPGFEDKDTWNPGAAERYLPSSPYFDDVNMNLPNAHHASDHLPLDVKYRLTNPLNGKSSDISVKQFNILAERAAFFKNFQAAPMYREKGSSPTEPLTETQFKDSGKNELLDMAKRKPVLQKEMLDGVDGEPTIVTFEEVDNQDEWKEWLEGRGYTVIVQKRNFGEKTIREKNLTEDSKDGNLIAWKKDKMEQVGTEVRLDYDESMFKKKYERAALIVKLQDKSSGAQVVVAATHLSYDNVSDQGKKQQLNEIEQYIAAVNQMTESGKIPAVMNGDLNSVPESEVVTTIKSAGFTSAYAAVNHEEPPATSAYASSVYKIEPTRTDSRREPAPVQAPVEAASGKIPE